MISMLVTFWGSTSVLSSRVTMYKRNAATGAVWKVSGWYKSLWQCTRMQKEDTQCELKWPQEYKVWAATVQGSGDNDRRWQGVAWDAGAKERGPTSISMEQWGKDDQDVSHRAPESSHQGTVGGGHTGRGGGYSAHCVYSSLTQHSSILLRHLDAERWDQQTVLKCLYQTTHYTPQHPAGSKTFYICVPNMISLSGQTVPEDVQKNIQIWNGWSW